MKIRITFSPGDKPQVRPVLKTLMHDLFNSKLDNEYITFMEFKLDKQASELIDIVEPEIFKITGVQQILKRA